MLWSCSPHSQELRKSILLFITSVMILFLLVSWSYDSYLLISQRRTLSFYLLLMRNFTKRIKNGEGNVLLQEKEVRGWGLMIGEGI